MNKNLTLSNGDYIKFKRDGMDIAVLIHRDEAPMDPIRDYDPPGHMVCFHSRYKLGDEHDYNSMEEFLADMVKKVTSNDELYRRIVFGNAGIEVCRDDGLVVLLEHYGRNHNDKIDVVSACETVDAAISELRDELEILEPSTLMKLIDRNKVVMLPLYLYDHSGITISTAPFPCSWDSGCVGMIYMTLEEFLADGHNKPEWPAKAQKILEDVVEEYDDYLTGNVYGYEEYLVGDDGELEYDSSLGSCWGFFGDNILKNGIADSVYGLRAAIEAGEYETGTATEHKEVKITYSI